MRLTQRSLSRCPVGRLGGYRGGDWLVGLAVLLAVNLSLMTLPATAQEPVPDAKDSSDAETWTEADTLAAAKTPIEGVPGQVSVTLAPQEITVGGRVTAEVTLVWMGEPPSGEVRFPTWQETWGDAEILETSEPESFEDQSGRFIYQQRVTLTAFDAGDVKLPPVAFALPLSERTLTIRSSADLGFQIVSVLPTPPEAAAPDAASEPDALGAEPVSENAEALEPRANAPPESLDGARLPFLITVALLAVALLVSVEVLRRRLASLPADADDAMAPSFDPVTLLAPLAELEARLERLDPSLAEPAHTGLSLALRRFLGRRLGFHAVESTTTEIQRQLLRGTLPQNVTGKAVGLLRDSDLVKFAGVEVESSTVRRRLDDTRELGRRLEALLAPVMPKPGDADETPASSVAEERAA